MNLDELYQLVGSGESERVEFKKTTGQRTEAARTVCAMLNRAGGFLFFGVTPAGKVCGQIVTTQTLEEVHNELRKIEPLALPDVETVALPTGNCVIALRVPGGGGPYAYDGRLYLRNGPTTIIMPQTLYERKLLERVYPWQRWENQPAEGYTLGDLDASEVTRTICRRRKLKQTGTRSSSAFGRQVTLPRNGCRMI